MVPVISHSILNSVIGFGGKIREGSVALCGATVVPCAWSFRRPSTASEVKLLFIMGGCRATLRLGVFPPAFRLKRRLRLCATLFLAVLRTLVLPLRVRWFVLLALAPAMRLLSLRGALPHEVSHASPQATRQYTVPRASAFSVDSQQ